LDPFGEEFVALGFCLVCEEFACGLGCEGVGGFWEVVFLLPVVDAVDCVAFLDHVGGYGYDVLCVVGEGVG